MKAQNIVGKEFYRKDGVSSVIPRMLMILDIVTDDNGDQFYDVQYDHNRNARDNQVYPKDVYDNYIARTPTHVISYHSVQSEYNGIKFTNNIIVANRIRKVEGATPIVIFNTFEFLKRRYIDQTISSGDVMNACTIRCMWDKFDQNSIPYFGNGVKLEKLSYAYMHRPLGLVQYSLPFDMQDPKKSETTYWELFGLFEKDIAELNENLAYNLLIMTHFDQIVYNNLLDVIDVDFAANLSFACKPLIQKNKYLFSVEQFMKFIEDYKSCCKGDDEDLKKQFNDWWNRFFYMAINIEAGSNGYIYDGAKKINVDSLTIVADLTTEDEINRYINMNKDHHYAKLYFCNNDELVLLQYDEYEQSEAPAISMDELEKFFKLKIAD